LNLVDLYLAGTTSEVQYPKLIENSILMTREQSEEHVEILKGVSTENFNSMTKYTKQEIERFLVEYVNKNEDIEGTLQQLSINFREFEDTLFDIRVKQKIIIAPMCEYIENWLKLALIKIIENDQMEVVGTIHETATKENMRATSTTK
jgi:hypothetical protein